MSETRLTDEMVEKAMTVGVAKFCKLVKKVKIPKNEGYISISVVDFSIVEATELLQVVIGNPSMWDYDYEGLAKSKTLSSVRNGMSMGKLLKHPELVLPGDVKYSGNTLVGNIDISVLEQRKRGGRQEDHQEDGQSNSVISREGS